MDDFAKIKGQFANRFIFGFDRRAFLKRLSCAAASPLLLNSSMAAAHDFNSVVADTDNEIHNSRDKNKEIFINLSADLIFRYPNETPFTERASGTVVRRLGVDSCPYEISLNTDSGTPFSTLGAGPIIILFIIAFVLDFPCPANGREQRRRQSLGLAQPVNFLDISNGEYSGKAEVDLEQGQGLIQKTFEVNRIDSTHFDAKITTVHEYPRTLGENLVRVLPHDIAIVDNGLGKACGRSQTRWLSNEGGIVTGDMLIDIQFKNTKARIPFPEIFSYDYDISDLSVLPARIKSVGVMRAVC